MSRTQKVLYLAGPIAGCNEVQMTGWRRWVRENYKSDFKFIDPTEKLAEANHAIVKQDRDSIRQADGVLANMWRESIGTAIGVAQASEKGRIVVVVDQNHINSRILAFYAHAIVPTVKKGVEAIKGWFHTTEKITHVLKHGDETEAFSVDKLCESLRQPCIRAGQDEVLVPVKVMPEVLRQLEMAHVTDGMITTSAIDEAVRAAVDHLRVDDDFRELLSGVLEERRHRKHEKEHTTRLIPIMNPQQRTAGGPLKVPVRTRKNHGTIWGKSVADFDRLPGDVRKIFDAIRSVRGISKIIFGVFSSKPSGPKQASVKLTLSKQPDRIDGVYQGAADAGNSQTFEIFVHDSDERQEIFAATRKLLLDQGVLADRLDAENEAHEY